MMVRRSGDWLSAQVGEEVVMMSVQKGRYLGLNEMGARIWALIDAPCSVDEVCTQLMQEFEVGPEVCRREIDAFVSDLVKHGAAVVDRP